MPSACSLGNPISRVDYQEPRVRPTTFPTKPQEYDLKFKDAAS
jgi:hypothetical protein